MIMMMVIRNGEVVSLTGRFEAQMAGARHILLVNNVQVGKKDEYDDDFHQNGCDDLCQEDDTGTYMLTFFT